MGIRRFFILFLFLAATPSPAQAQSCGDYKLIPAKIHVSPEIPKPEYNHKKTIKDINDAKARKRKDEWLKKNGLTGVMRPADLVTQGYFEQGMATYFLSKLTKLPPNRPGANRCLYFESIDLTMLFQSRIVIPKEFPPGKCEYRLIHKHELQHYQALRESAQEVVRQAQKDMPAILSDIENRKYNARSFAERAKAMQAAVHPAVMAYMQKNLKAELDKRNDDIDSPESYVDVARKMKACNPPPEETPAPDPLSEEEESCEELQEHSDCGD